MIEVYAVRPDAFDDVDAALLRALASQAAIAITNARLIDELARSQAELARAAEAERTLREIAARVSAILDPAEVLEQIVDETARLLESDGARIDLYDPEIDALRWAYSGGRRDVRDPRVGANRWPQAGPGRGRHRVRRAGPVLTDDYLADERFETTRRSRPSSARPASARSSPCRWRRAGGSLGSCRSSPASRAPTRRRRRGPDRARDAGLDRHPQRPPDRGAGRSRAVIERRAEAEQACARSRPGSPPSASRATSSSASSTRRSACCAPTAR